MSRPLWRCRIELTLENGQQGTVALTANLVAIKELREQFAKALRMAETLSAEPPAEVERQPFKVVS